jgi:hypothetical protein
MDPAIHIHGKADGIQGSYNPTLCAIGDPSFLAIYPFSGNSRMGMISIFESVNFDGENASQQIQSVSIISRSQIAPSMGAKRG